MATAAFTAWVQAGRIWRPARPLNALATRLRGYGYTVYTLGNAQHLQADPPEDHCPFSATGWPIRSPLGVVFAGDIMPPPAASGLPTLDQLGAQLAADKNAGIPGANLIKYINWTPTGQPCRHESWQPGHLIQPSSDTGHNHVSWRSDCADSTAGDDYDPVARIRNGNTPTPVPAPVPTPPAPTPWPGRYLVWRRGVRMMHGTDVLQWQRRVVARFGPVIAGIDVSTPGWADGWYGPQSAGVCRALQRQFGITIDGVAGPVTWRAMFG